MARRLIASVVGLFVLATMFGCGVSTPVSQPTEMGAVSVTVPFGEVMARDLADRYGNVTDVLIQRRNLGHVVQEEQVATPQSPTVTFVGLPAGTQGEIYAAARDAQQNVIASAVSTPFTIEAGNVVTVELHLPGTNPTFSGRTPADGSTVTSSDVTVAATVTDPGGKTPTVSAAVDGNVYSPVQTGSWSVNLVGLADGEHTIALTATTASGGSASTSWSFTVSTILDQFKDWPGYVHTFVDNISAPKQQVTVSTPPNSTVSTVEIVVFNDGNGNRLRVEGYLDLITGFLTGGWRLVELNGVAQPNPGGSTGIWNYNSSTGLLLIPNVTAYADGYSKTISLVSVTLSSTVTY